MLKASEVESCAGNGVTEGMGDAASRLRRGEAVALPPSSEIGPGERVVLDHYLAHTR